jgi:hypothetical protein
LYFLIIEMITLNIMASTPELAGVAGLGLFASLNDSYPEDAEDGRDYTAFY